MASWFGVLMRLMVLGALWAPSQTQFYPTSLTYLRHRCPTIFPTHTQLRHSGAVVLTGIVDEIKPVETDQEQLGQYLASVRVLRVLYGSRSLRGTHIQISGFNSDSKWCHSNARFGESWIFTLQPISYPDYFRLNSSLIKLTLHNLEKYDAIIADIPYRIKPKIPELPCETKYCENNAICVEDPYSADGTRCECLTYCKQKYAPVCGSDDETYNNECELRMRSCRAGKNLFVKSLNSCHYSPRSGYTSRVESSSSTRTVTSPPSTSTYYHRRYQYRTQSGPNTIPGSSNSEPELAPPPARLPSLPDSDRSTTRHTYQSSRVVHKYSY